MGCIMDDAEREAEAAGTTVAREEEDQASAVPSSTESGLRKECTELNERYLRLVADFENFRRRTAKERESVAALATERFAVDILEVVDNFDRALNADDTHLREGVDQIRRLLAAQLQRHGIIPMESLQRPFNPAEHEAVAHILSDEAEGTVINEVSRGYRMHDRVIRHAKVAVSKGNQHNQET